MSSAATREVDVDALNAFLGDIGSYNYAHIFVPRDKLLYHYTDLRGLQGIVESHDLWLTHSRYLNDEEELTHGLDVAVGVLKEERDAAAAGSTRRGYVEKLEALLRQPIPEGVYTCSFCETDNVLSQWRGYAANGTGVSLRMSPMGFSDGTGPDCPHGLLRLWKVFYSRDTKRKIVKDAVDFGFDHNYPNVSSPDSRAQLAADAIQFFIPTFKNEDFKEECECRLIFTPKPASTLKPRFRVGHNMLVPFFGLRSLTPGLAPLLPISGLTVGPSANKKLNVESARMLLAQNGYADVAADASATTYRG